MGGMDGKEENQFERQADVRLIDRLLGGAFGAAIARANCSWHSLVCVEVCLIPHDERSHNMWQDNGSLLETFNSSALQS